MDTELETQIETLRDTQRKYANILRLARALTSHFYHVIQTQVSFSKKERKYFVNQADLQYRTFTPFRSTEFT